MQDAPSTADTDRQAIAALVMRQFGSLSWKPGQPAEWSAFADDFHPAAALYAAARPARPQSPAEFVERMKTLSQTSLRSFEEALLGIEIHLFGNVAVAIAGCEAVENAHETSRNVEMLLLVKDGASWKIVAQAWDRATPDRPLPKELLGGGLPGPA